MDLGVERVVFEVEEFQFGYGWAVRVVDITVDAAVVYRIVVLFA